MYKSKSNQRLVVNFLLQSLLSALTLIQSPFNPMLPQWHVKDPGHSAGSAGGKLHLVIHPLPNKVGGGWLYCPTQHRTQANERPQPAAYSSNKIEFFCRPNQHEDNGHTQPHIHSKHRPQRKLANGTIDSFFQTTKSAKFVFPPPSQTTDISTITQPINY